MDAELEVKEIKIPDMNLEGNIELPWVDIEGQDSPLQVIEIGDPNIPQYSSPNALEIALDIPSEPEGPTHISTPAT